MNDLFGKLNQIHSAKEGVPRVLKWLETLLLTGFFVVLGAWNRPDDPFYVSGGFPWPVLAPLLVGLRYGFFMALVSALLIIGGLGLHLRETSAGQAFPVVWAIGIMAVSLLAGEFRDYWGRQLEKLNASNRYRQVRLEEFTRNFYLLKVSHDRLEQQLAGSSSSLREALRRLYAEFAHTGPQGLSRENAGLMLQLLVRYGQLQIAAIYPMKNHRLGDEPIATVGAFRPVKSSDPLLAHALAERSLVSVQTEYRKHMDDLDTDLLAAIPLIDSEDRIIAMCLIEAMPFFNFQPKSLRLLAILAGHMADIVQEQQSVPTAISQEWRHFHMQLARVGRDAARFGLPAALVALEMHDAHQATIITSHIRKIRRGLDVVVETGDPEVQQVIILMPLTDELGLAGYMQRLNEELQERLGKPLHNQLSLQDSLLVSDRQQAEEWLQRFLNNGAKR
ncbi:PelD GGDEF domain-containing protein [Marinobacter goseongensis]|uniref:PelD GGDEF domain-containing protein n=1 Tax=Marinobacter goseongensis TaxID=453838 RepID=UPI00200361E4|nr:PelD GGDEF domain-containing protein [Marinobacter goseongensis]MCK7551657.1 PelD GGDEF domain-containing protein [Marinobacter goseongensis]